MNILIKGMEMPEENHDYGGVKVWVDLRVYTDGSVLCRNLAGDFVDLGKCAVEVPTPHGRLIDADALMELYEPAPEDGNEWEHYTTTISVIRQNIKDAPTVIESEEADHDQR